MNIDHLMELGVIEVSGADELRISDEFLSEWRKLRGDFRDGRRRLADQTDEAGHERILSDIEVNHPDIAACLYVVGERDSELDVESRIKYALLVSKLVGDPPRSEGGPNHFWPIHGDELGLYHALYEKCVAYVWREDCAPCDRMKSHFNAIFESPPEDLMLVAVYGPAYDDYLLGEYDVGIAPTTLLLTNDRVDLRFVGAKEKSVVEREIETLRNL